MNTELTQTRAQIKSLHGTMQERIDAGEMTQVDPPLDHYFTDGLYGRRIYCPANITIVTKVHLSNHITIALKGTCTVVDENGVRKEVSAPGMWVTNAGAQRAIYCHDEVEWVTVHATNKETVPEVEFDIFADTFEEYVQRVSLLENKP